MQAINVFENGIGYLGACLSCYLDNCAYFMLYAFALLFILIKGDKREKELFLPGAFVLLVTVYNPVAPIILDKFFDVNNEYYRLFWITPVVVLVPYVAVRIIALIKEKSSNAAVLCAFLFVIVGLMGGNLLFTQEIKIRENGYKVPDELIEIDSIIHEDAKTLYPKAFFEYDYNMEIRQYDPKMLLCVDREDYLYAVQYSYTDEMLADENNPQYKILAPLVRNQVVETSDFLAALEATGTEYIVVSAAHPLVPYLRNAGLTEVAKTDTHTIYRYEIQESSEYEYVDYSQAEHKFSFRRLK